MIKPPPRFQKLASSMHSVENFLIKFNTALFMFGAKHHIKYNERLVSTTLFFRVRVELFYLTQNYQLSLHKSRPTRADSCN